LHFRWVVFFKEWSQNTLNMADGKPHINLPDVKPGLYPTSKKEWVEFVIKNHDEGMELRRRHEFIWAVTLAYYKGYQNIVFDPVTGILNLNRDTFQPYTVNRIAPFIEARHAKLTKNRPTAIVQPNTTDKVDKAAAKAAERIHKHLWRELEMEEMYDTNQMQMLIAGNAFVENMWDPTAGQFIMDDKFTDSDVLSIDDENEEEKEKVFLGEVHTGTLTAFNIIPANDQILRLKDQPWIIKRTYQNLAFLYTLYPHLQEKIHSDKDNEQTQPERMVTQLSSPISSVMSQDASTQDKGTSEAVVKHFMLAPNYQYPKGLMVIVINKELAMLSEFPDDYGKNIYPIVHFKEKKDGHNFWGQSTIERLIPVQRAINILRQKKIKNFSLMAAGKWLIAKGSQIPDDAISDEEGEIIEYNPAVNKPEQARIAPLPNYVESLNQELITDFRDTGGQRETTFTAGPNLTAGVAMQTQTELTDEVLGPLIKRVGRSMQTVAQQQLLLVDQNWTDPRKVRVLGDNGKFSIEMLDNADLRHNTDIHFEIDSLFPDMRGAKQQRAFDLWDRKVIQDPKKLIQVLRHGDFDSIIDDQEYLDDSIEQAILMIKRGDRPEITQFQNHPEFVDQMSKWMNTPDWLRLPKERKQLTIDIVKEHMQNIMQSLPNQGQPVEQQNPASVGTPFGPTNPQT